MSYPQDYTYATAKDSQFQDYMLQDKGARWGLYILIGSALLLFGSLIMASTAGCKRSVMQYSNGKWGQVCLEYESNVSYLFWIAGFAGVTFLISILYLVVKQSNMKAKWIKEGNL